MTSMRRYAEADRETVQDLWIRINRELAPDHLKDLFEDYITEALLPELDRLEDVFSARNRAGFWVVEDGRIIGTFGIEQVSDAECELRRMYLEKDRRGTGLSAHMLAHAEAEARKLGYATMLASTAEVQGAAIQFYLKQGYTLLESQVAKEQSVRTVGGGMKRFYFRKDL